MSENYEMRLMEVDEVAVNRELWERVKSTDDFAAKQDIRKAINGLKLYCHLMPVRDDETVVRLRQLEAECILEAVTIRTRPETHPRELET